MDIYAEVTERIIEQMEQGYIPWEQPWVGSNDIVSHATGKPYSMLNQMMLSKPGEYATFKQVQDEGGKVKKGAKSKLVVFWTMLLKEDEDTGDEKKIPYLKYSRVFHLDDCERLTAKYTKEPQKFDNQPIDKAQAVFDGYISRELIKLEHTEQGGAFYRPSADMIHLPLMEQFKDSISYYDTAFHECVHSTGHERRLKRNGIMSVGYLGNTEYSKEELIAELGACSLMHTLGIETKNAFRNTAAYIQNWLTTLKNDKRLLVGASTAANKAVNFILGKEC